MLSKSQAFEYSAKGMGARFGCRTADMFEPHGQCYYCALALISRSAGRLATYAFHNTIFWQKSPFLLRFFSFSRSRQVVARMRP